MKTIILSFQVAIEIIGSASAIILTRGLTNWPDRSGVLINPSVQEKP